MRGGGIPKHSPAALPGPTGSGQTAISDRSSANPCRSGPARPPGSRDPPAAPSQGELCWRGLLSPVESGAIEIMRQPPLETSIDDLGRHIGARRMVTGGIDALQHALTHLRRLHAFLRALDDIPEDERTTTIRSREGPRVIFPEALAVGGVPGTSDDAVIWHCTVEVTGGGIVFARPPSDRERADITAGTTVTRGAAPSPGGRSLR